MSRLARRAIVVGMLSLSFTNACAQRMPPIRALGAVTEESNAVLASAAAIRPLPGDRVIVNDITARRVVMFDSSLAEYKVIADSTGSAKNAYGPRPGGLIRYTGDSTLFVDPFSLSMMVIDGAGKIARVMSVPNSNDAGYLVGGPYGTPALDPLGQLVYRGPTMMPANSSSAPASRLNARTQMQPDSAPVVRFNFQSRRLDTVAVYKVPRLYAVLRKMNSGMLFSSVIYDPVPITDDWALLADGTVAVIRGQDFHIDWVSADGTRTSSPKIPFDFQHLNDEQKRVLVDSTRAYFEAARAAQIAKNMGVDPQAAGAAAKALPPVDVFDPGELPDYRPPFPPGATLVAPDGTLWIRTTATVGASLVYDVVSRRDGLIDRVQVPPFRIIVGFGSADAVYLAVKDSTGVRLERAHTR